jgi:addiction module RelE/StbE family toxin
MIYYRFKGKDELFAGIPPNAFSEYFSRVNQSNPDDGSHFGKIRGLIDHTDPNDILKRYEKWKDIASISDPTGLRLIKGFHDEALSGRWKDYRSSRLGLQWRLIYRVIKEDLLFQVASITAHDYRRP